MEKLYIQIFEDYNRLIENAFNELISHMSEESLSYLDEQLVSDTVNEKQAIWQKEPKSYLDGQTPEEYFSSFEDNDLLLEIFREAALVCDREIPVVLADKLMNSSDYVQERILDIAFDEQYRRDNENIVIAAAAIFTLGRSGRKDVLESLLKILMSCTENDDLIMESISGAVKQYGSNALDIVSSFIEDQENIDFRNEYLVMILPELSKKDKSDRIYRLLKSMFLKMDNKILAASALAEYGDGRAIPALRGYLEKNADKLDRETFFEIKKAIEILGGNIEGLKLPSFKNIGTQDYLN